MSDERKIRVLRKALEEICNLAIIPEEMVGTHPFCEMVTHREDCRTHRVEWSAIHAAASKALRDTE